MRATQFDSPAFVLAAVIAAAGSLCASCVSFDPPDSFDSVDPAGRMHAAGSAAAAGDKSAIPSLVQMLASDDPAERLVAIGSLERLTGERMGYDPVGSTESRRAAIERWRAWVASGSGGANHPATVVGSRTDR